MTKLSLNLTLFSLPTETTRHDADYLENNLNRINNLVNKEIYDYERQKQTNIFNLSLPISSNEKDNEVIIIGSSSFVREEKTGIEKLITSINKLNKYISNDLNKMLELKENYSNLDKSLIFDYTFKSDIVSDSEMNSFVENLLKEQNTANSFLLEKMNGNPCILGSTYTTKELQEQYGTYFNEPLLAGIFSTFINPNNSNEYIMPDIVFEKDASSKKTNYNVYLQIDNEEKSKEVQEQITQSLIDFAGSKYALLVKTNVRYSYDNGILTVDLTKLISAGLTFNKIDQQMIDNCFVLPTQGGNNND